MKKRLFLTALCLFVLAVSIQAADTAQISVTVTLENISVSVAPTSWAIGMVAAESVTESGTYTVTNNGNIAENIAIQCGNSADWTVSATVGIDLFKMAAQGGDLGTSGYTSINASQTLKTNLASSGTVADLKLQFSAPQAGSIADPQTIAVTLTAAKYVP
ncbi:hypothetical protein JW926_17845 [Candidatus Sumerlaeota bacterium]|nr:hypothetical protein [Candidatus Sumerlaeota bacterium]